MPIFFIHSDQISGRVLNLTGPLVRHIVGALRKKKGDQILFIDEQKVGYVTQLQEIGLKRIVGKVLEEKRQPSSTSSVSITLGQAYLKAKRMDWIFQKATELGVSRIIPFVTERTVVEPKPERVESQHQRWREILKEAAQQSGRWDIPILDFPTDFLSLVKEGPSFDFSVVPWEKENGVNLKKALNNARQANPRIRKILVLIGPEGGFSDNEVTAARENQIIPVSLGWRILRAETACLATLALFQYEIGDIGVGT